MTRILLVEDEPVIRAELARMLRRAGHEVQEAEDVPAALQRVPRSFDLVLTDVRLPGESGDMLLDHAGDIPVILMTAFGSVSSAVDAMKRGAVDYLTKPIDPAELLLVVQRALSRRAPRVRVEPVDATAPGIVGSSQVMRDVLTRVELVARTDTTVLILGESGTGKELVARAVHQNNTRRKGPFVAVNCASLPEGLMESELFGHERGAFTGAAGARQGLFESAEGGTLFLDEIGELPLAAQARLLRVLQEREVRRVGANRARSIDVRLVAATHRDLRAMVRDGEFRQDLYFRLNVFDLTLPPLRDRGQDVFELALVLGAQIAARLGRPAPSLTPEARQAMSDWHWPGNVRELENRLERALILSEDGVLTPSLLRLDEVYTNPRGVPAVGAPGIGGAGAAAGTLSSAGAAPSPAASSPAASSPGASAPVSGQPASLEDYFRQFVTTHQHDMTETELAQALGISRKTLWERRKRLGIPRP